MFWGLEDIDGHLHRHVGSAVDKQGRRGMWPNDADGNAWSNSTDGFPAVLPAAGYKVVDPGRLSGR